MRILFLFLFATITFTAITAQTDSDGNPLPLIILPEGESEGPILVFHHPNGPSDKHYLAVEEARQKGVPNDGVSSYYTIYLNGKSSWGGARPTIKIFDSHKFPNTTIQSVGYLGYDVEIPENLTFNYRYLLVVFDASTDEDDNIVIDKVSFYSATDLGMFK